MNLKLLSNRVYRYRPVGEKLNYLFTELGGNLWCSTHTILNDPFDGLSKMTDKIIERKEKLESGETETWQSKLTWTVACFSENYDIAPMWAHYTQHKGICIGYNIEILNKAIENFNEHPMYKKFNYQAKFKKVNYEPILPNKYNDTEDALTYKTEEWRYENEWRLLYQFASIPKSNQLGVSFAIPNKCIQEIIFGLKTDQHTKHAIKDFLDAKGLNIDFHQLEISKDTSKLIRADVDWTRYG